MASRGFGLKGRDGQKVAPQPDKNLTKKVLNYRIVKERNKRRGKKEVKDKRGNLQNENRVCKIIYFFNFSKKKYAR